MTLPIDPPYFYSPNFQISDIRSQISDLRFEISGVLFFLTPQILDVGGGREGEVVMGLRNPTRPTLQGGQRMREDWNGQGFPAAANTNRR